MWGSGRLINHMGLASMCGGMEMNMRENGKRVCDMGKELTSLRLVILIWESITGVKLKDMVSIDGRMGTSTLVSSSTVRNTDKAIGRRTARSNQTNTQECTRLI